MNTHRDFVWLSQKVQVTMGEYISPTTLKRLWGHQKDYNHPSAYTLNFLSRYLGYADYATFLSDEPEENVASNMLTDCYMTANLSVGDRLQLSWQPDRVILVNYKGNDTFEVEEATNCKISVGDTFKIAALVNGETLTLGGLIHNGQGPFVYLIGKQGGVSIEPVATEGEE